MLIGRTPTRGDMCSLPIVKYLCKEAKLGKNHYSHGKRMRELAKKQKQEEKKERKLAKQNPQPDENAEAAVEAPAAVDAPAAVADQ